MMNEAADRRSAWIWGGAFFVGMFGTGFLARQFDLPAVPSALVMLPPMLLLIPLVRASERAQAACGGLSAAARRYNRRSLAWSFAYVAVLVAAVIAGKALRPDGAALWLVAVLPALPVLYMLWTMGRYLAEETDEYLRMRVVIAALWATGLMLALATVWGFLETFALAPHVPGWAAVPVWAIGLGLGGLVDRWRGA